MIRTLSRMVLRLMSQITASQSRVGLHPIPALPINASDVSDAADRRFAERDFPPTRERVVGFDDDDDDNGVSDFPSESSD